MIEKKWQVLIVLFAVGFVLHLLRYVFGVESTLFYVPVINPDTGGPVVDLMGNVVYVATSPIMYFKKYYTVWWGFVIFLPVVGLVLSAIFEKWNGKLLYWMLILTGVWILISYPYA